MPCWALIRGLCDTGAPEDVEGVGLEVGLLDRPVGLDVGGAGPMPLISSTMGASFSCTSSHWLPFLDWILSSYPFCIGGYFGGHIQKTRSPQVVELLYQSPSHHIVWHVVLLRGPPARRLDVVALGST